MLELLKEIGQTLKRNKLRAILTGFVMAWGIFMLVLLLGIGKGFQNGYSKEFKDDAVNSIRIRKGQVSRPYRGQQVGKYIQLTNQDVEHIAKNVDGIEYISARWNQYRNNVVSYKDKSVSYIIKGVHPDHKYLEKTIITKGRFLNDWDISQRRKVVAIGQWVKQELFGDQKGLGKWIFINNVSFQVVGIFRDEGNDDENKIVFIPVTTAQSVFEGAPNIDHILFSIPKADLEKSRALAAEVKERLSKVHRFDPQDPRALFVRNNYENFQKFLSVFNAIDIFIWIIGLMTILAGIIVVGTIVLVSVKERSKEIGVRKALGATPASITKMILLESLIITSIFGYFGMMMGLLSLEWMNQIFLTQKSLMISNPSVSLDIVLISTAILVFSGVLAGVIPAIKASKIKPAIALRSL